MALETGLVICPSCEGTFSAKLPIVKKMKSYTITCKHCNSEIIISHCNLCNKIKYKDAECKECLKVRELELTDEMLKRNDEIDNAVFECIEVLAERHLDWNMQAIHEATEGIKCAIESVYGIKVRHYAVVTNEDGSQSFEDGLEDEKEDFTNMKDFINMKEYKEWEGTCLKKYGFYVHGVPYEGYTNYHTHGIFKTFGHLDFQIRLALESGVAGNIFNNLVRRVKSGGMIFHGDTIEGLIDNGYKCKAFQTTEMGLPVIRIILPDKDGKFPEDEGCSEFFKDQMKEDDLEEEIQGGDNHEHD